MEEDSRREKEDEEWETRERERREKDEREWEKNRKRREKKKSNKNKGQIKAGDEDANRGDEGPGAKTGGIGKPKAERTGAAGLQVPRRLGDEHDGRTADEKGVAENGSGNGMHAGDGPSEEIGVVIHDED